MSEPVTVRCTVLRAGGLNLLVQVAGAIHTVDRRHVHDFSASEVTVPDWLAAEISRPRVAAEAVAVMTQVQDRAEREARARLQPASRLQAHFSEPHERLEDDDMAEWRCAFADPKAEADV